MQGFVVEPIGIERFVFAQDFGHGFVDRLPDAFRVAVLRREHCRQALADNVERLASELVPGQSLGRRSDAVAAERRQRFIKVLARGIDSSEPARADVGAAGRCSRVVPERFAKITRVLAFEIFSEAGPERAKSLWFGDGLRSARLVVDAGRNERLPSTQTSPERNRSRK